jgi:hypothetical protein
MKWIKIVFIVIFLFSFSVKVNAQELQEELKEVYKKFSDNSFKMDMEMTIYFWDTSQEPKVSKGIVKKKKANYYTEFEGQIKLKNKNYNIIVNELEKQLFYWELGDHPSKENEALTMMSDTNSLSKVKLLKSTSKYKEYEVEVGAQGIAKMSLKINKNKILSEVVYYYPETEENTVKHVKIVYKNVTFNASFLEQEFSEKKYFNLIEGKKVLTKAYKSYTLVNIGS